MVFLIIAYTYTESLICVFGQPLSPELHTALLELACYGHAVHIDWAFR